MVLPVLMRTLGAVLALVTGLARPAPAQRTSDPGVAGVRPVASVPFGVGEHLVYKVTLGPFGKVGTGSFEVVALDTVRGYPTYRLRMKLKGGIAFVHVDDDMQSWLDVSTLASRRFKQDQKEYHYERHRTLEFFPEERRWTQPAKDESGVLPTDSPLDDISFLYYVRTLPLEVGQTYTLDRYFDEKGNPVVVTVERKDTVTVPAGTFPAIVVRPVIQTKGLFGQGGKAEVYFSDDSRRLVLQVRSSVPVIGSLNMYLQGFALGDKLPASPAASASSERDGHR